MKCSYVLWQAVCLLGLGSAWGAQPVINSFSPMVGSPGDKVDIYGSGFYQANVSLYFWQNHPATYALLSDTHIQATVPAGTTTGPLGIQLGSQSVLYTTGDYLAIGNGPYLAAITNTFGATNDTVIITGVHLTNTTLVTFGGVTAPNRVTTPDGHQITVTVPYGAKSGPVAVTTSAGGPSNGPSFLVIGPGPYITGFTPDRGSPGVMVNVTGRFFDGVTNVTFNGVPGTNLFVGPSSLQVYAPGGVATGPITVRAPLGISSSISNFLVPPTFTGMTPATGRAGTNVIITGTSFSNTYSVTFNGLAATSFVVLSNSSIRATVPVGASDGLVRVFAPYGSALSAANFIVQPTVFGFSPNYGTPGVSSITITGANFNVGAPTVRFNGAAASSVSGVSFGQLTAVVPGAATTGPISVSTTDGSHTNVANFFVPASISGFTPTNRPPGASVVVSGQNFLGASAVAFNGVPASFTPPTNNTTLVCVVPADFTTGPISVTVPANTATSSGLYYAAPAITGFSPTHGLPGASVTITGQSFLGATAVRFNGLSAPIVSVNNSQIVATVPGGARSGPITVEAPAGTNTTSTTFSLDYTSDVDVNGSVAPNPVTVSSNLVYTFTLANHGPWDAFNVRWTNLLSSVVDVVNVSASVGTWTTNGNTITGNLGTLPVQSSATVTITVAPNSAGTISDFMSLGSDNPDPVPGNNTLTLLTFAQPLPLLSIRFMTNQVRLSWPSVLSNYVLESSMLLSPATSWSSNAGTSILSGSIRYVLEPVTNSAKFYRLRK